VIDNAATRRGQTALNARHGNHMAVLVGDMLVLQAFSLLLQLDMVKWQKKEKIFNILYQTVNNMCLGEICQHQLRQELRLAWSAEYLHILERKTALLMSACCECGAMLAGKRAPIVRRDVHDQDAQIQRPEDLVPTARTYIVQAKQTLQAFNGNPAAHSLTALCDLLLPENGNLVIFEQTV
jgi:octaprenyl-diphosphate synthase